MWKLRLNGLLIILALIAISFGWNIHEINNDTVAMFYSPQTRFWELWSGALLAHLTLYRQLKNEAPRLKDMLSIIGGALIITGVFVITRSDHFPGLLAVIPVLGAMLIISAGTHAWVNRKLSHPWLVWVGLISFPLYLWHWPLLSFAYIVESKMPSITIRIGALCIAIILAWLTYILGLK